jgi:HEPN domain-containing protein
MKTMNRWKDWYGQGIRNMAHAQLDMEHEFYEWACFTSQQAAELLLKAVGLKLGVTLWGHSLSELLGLLATRTDIPSDIIAKAQTLDLYYIPARYPNGFASGKPADYFNRDKAKEALDAAGDIQRFCESLLS